MKQAVNNIFIEDYSFMKSKPFFSGNKLKFIIASYSMWMFLSIMLAYMQPYKYASYFTDLPNNLKHMPPFVLSLAYLVLFIPAIAVSIIFALYILFIVVRNTLTKQK